MSLHKKKDIAYRNLCHSKESHNYSLLTNVRKCLFPSLIRLSPHINIHILFKYLTPIMQLKLFAFPYILMFKCFSFIRRPIIHSIFMLCSYSILFFPFPISQALWDFHVHWFLLWLYWYILFHEFFTSGFKGRKWHSEGLAMGRQF